MISKRSTEMVAESKLSLPEPQIGCRIECHSYFGTIRYIGPIEGHPGTWVGIEWDDPTRGKHNGLVNGIQYFETKHPKSGSLLHKEKINLGQTAVSSIIARYKSPDFEKMAKLYEEELLSFQKSMNAPFLELVGFDKVADKLSDFDSLQVVNLRLQNVNSPGEPMELKNLCPNIKELDISKNLITSWLDVFDICFQLEHLEWLNVSENLLLIPENYAEYCFPHIKTLICGYMDLKWSDILKLSAVFPNIEELRAPFNDITSLDSSSDYSFTNLTLLDLEGNNIGDWAEIMKLSSINSLQQLTLENIQLKCIDFEVCDDSIFPNLNKININDNLLAEWKSVGELNKLPALKDLRFAKNPVLEPEKLTTREQLIMARISSLKILNGRQISPDERRGAEYDYLKKYGLEWIKVRNTEQEKEFLLNHNRYLNLIEKYGAPEESELVIQPNILKTTLVSLEILHKDRVISKKLPPTIQVQKLVMLVEKLFGLSHRPRLKYVSGTMSNIEIELDDETKEIGYYSIQNGDKIVIID